MKELLSHSLEALIVKLLQKGSIPTSLLLEQIEKERPGTAKQSAYLALRNLKAKEIVILANKTASLDHLWIKNMKSFFGLAENVYIGKDTGETFLDLEEGENIEYRFKSPYALDTFWAHACSVFFSVLRKNEQIFLYNPHQWFLLVRRTSEKQLMKECRETNHPWLQIIANKTPLDMKAASEFKGEMNRCQTLSKNPLPENYYVNVFGEYLIEVWLDTNTSAEISSIYGSTDDPAEAAVKLAQIVTKNKGKNKLRISRDVKKAEKVKRMFSKHFLF